jgi:hypothetical protein
MALKILIPESTVNICLNPSFEVDTANWVTCGGVETLTRVLTRSRFGRASLQVVTTGATIIAGEGARYNHNPTVQPGPITESVYVRGQGNVYLRVRASDNGARGVWVSKPAQLNDRYWQRLICTGQLIVPETRLTLAVRTQYPQAITYYVDGAMIEEKGHVTTYADGDEELELAPHDGNAYFEWVGQRHATASFRTKSYRLGGQFKNLVQGLDMECYPTESAGLGMPPLALGTQVYSGEERATVQSAKALPRSLNLLFHARRLPDSKDCDPQSLRALNRARKAIEDAMKPDLVHKPQSFLLRYEDGRCPMDLEAMYESGMEWEGDLRDPYLNSFGVRLFGPNPYWQADSQDTLQLSTSRVPATDHAYLIARLAGEWDGFGSASFPVRVLAVHPNGDVYAGGDFLNIGGVACRRIARWDGVAWNILEGAGLDPDDGSVYAIAFAANGDVYMGGTFTTLNGVPYNQVARYTPSTDTFAPLGGASPGVNSDVNALAVSKDGYVYVGGAFTSITAGPTDAYRIARYNGPTLDTWTTMGTNAGLNLDVETLEIDLDGTTLYLGGQFTNEYNVLGPALLPYICKWTTLFEAIAENGLNGTCRALRMAIDGKLYLAGDFTTAGFWTVAKVAIWNRVEFYPLGGDGDGLTGGARVNAISIDNRGNVYFGGDFTGATNDSLAAYVALWNGTRFGHVDAVFAAEVLAVAAKYDKLFRR